MQKSGHTSAKVRSRLNVLCERTIVLTFQSFLSFTRLQKVHFLASLFASEWTMSFSDVTIHLTHRWSGEGSQYLLGATKRALSANWRRSFCLGIFHFSRIFCNSDYCTQIDWHLKIQNPHFGCGTWQYRISRIFTRSWLHHSKWRYTRSSRNCVNGGHGMSYGDFYETSQCRRISRKCTRS